jgi:hypothetical protein
MRLVFEVSEAERIALRKYLRSLPDDTSYSALFRTLLRLAIDGTIKRGVLDRALAGPRPSLNVTLNEARGLVDDGPATQQERDEIGFYLARTGAKSISLARWRAGLHKEK